MPLGGIFRVHGENDDFCILPSLSNCAHDNIDDTIIPKVAASNVVKERDSIWFVLHAIDSDPIELTSERSRPITLRIFQSTEVPERHLAGSTFKRREFHSTRAQATNDGDEDDDIFTRDDAGGSWMLSGAMLDARSLSCFFLASSWDKGAIPTVSRIASQR